MAHDIRITLPDIYRELTEEELEEAKSFVLSREDTSVALQSAILLLLASAAEKIMRLCYQYDVDPRRFTISARYNSDLFKLISEVLDNLYERTLAVIKKYSLSCTGSKVMKEELRQYMQKLGNKGKSLETVISDRVWNFSRDIEAAVVAMRLAGQDETTAISRVRSNLQSVYTMREMSIAFAHRAEIEASFIRSAGVKKGNVGNSNSEANNIIRTARVTQSKVWMEYLRKTYEKDEAAGYMVIRMTDYDCPLCDSHCYIVWDLKDSSHFPPFHYRCQCVAVPIYLNS